MNCNMKRETKYCFYSSRITETFVVGKLYLILSPKAISNICLIALEYKVSKFDAAVVSFLNAYVNVNRKHKSKFLVENNIHS
jgi:hypothetical protein